MVAHVSRWSWGGGKSVKGHTGNEARPPTCTHLPSSRGLLASHEAGRGGGGGGGGGGGNGGIDGGSADGGVWDDADGGEGGSAVRVITGAVRGRRGGL